MRTLGIDPGLANTGVVFLDSTPDGAEVRAVTLLRTTRGGKDLRDDLRRYQVLQVLLRHVIRSFRPDVCVIEHFVPFRASRAAHKMNVLYGVFLGVLWEYSDTAGAKVRVVRPPDLKAFLELKRADTSKDAVQLAVEQSIDGFTDRIQKYPSAQREHLCDAGGLALMGFLDGSDEEKTKTLH